MVEEVKVEQLETAPTEEKIEETAAQPTTVASEPKTDATVEPTVTVVGAEAVSVASDAKPDEPVILVTLVDEPQEHKELTV